MLWSVLLAGVSGALAAVLATVVVRDPKNRRAAYTIVLVVSFVVLNQASRTYVLPEIQAWEAQRTAAEFIEQNRVLSLLASRHPEIREQFTALVVDLTRKGATSDEAFATGAEWGRQLVDPYLYKYLPRASDDALVNFVSMLVDTLNHLRVRQDDACFIWMFGGKGTTNTPISRTIGEAGQARMFQVMADVLESAISSPNRTIDRQRAEQIVEAFMLSMVEKRGEGFVARLAALEQPHAPGVDRKDICDVAAALYEDALLLQKGDRELLLRYLFAAEN